MSIEVSHDKQSGTFRLSYKRHIFIAAGLLFIAGGIASLTGPWWLPIVEAALGKSGLPIDSDHNVLVGVILILVGLGLLYYKHFHLDAQQRRLDSDRSAIQSVDLDPNRIRYFLSNLVDDHSYKSSEQSHFHKISNHFLLPENSFQDAETKRLYGEYAKASNDLELFLAKSFWIFPKERPSDGDYRYCLAPHLNMDREMIVYEKEKSAEYSSLSAELHGLVVHACESFNRLVSHAASKGHFC